MRANVHVRRAHGPGAHPRLGKQIADFCRRHHIVHLSFFGSVLREDFGPGNDIDVLVEFRPDHVPGWEIVDLEEEFSRMCGGQEVEFVNPKYLHPRLRDPVLKSAELQYAER